MVAKQAAVTSWTSTAARVTRLEAVGNALDADRRLERRRGRGRRARIPGVEQASLDREERGDQQRRRSATAGTSRLRRTEQGVWVTRLVSRRHCALLRIGIDGRRSAARAIPCAWIIAPAGTLGVVVHRTQHHRSANAAQGVRHEAGRARGGRATRAARRRCLALARLPLHAAGHCHGRRRRRFAWPSILAELDAPAVDPRGPISSRSRSAIRPGTTPARQVLDVWVLDTSHCEADAPPRRRPPTCRSSARASRGRTTAGSCSSARTDERSLRRRLAPGTEAPLAQDSCACQRATARATPSRRSASRGSGVSSMRSDTSQRRSAASGSRA